MSKKMDALERQFQPKGVGQGRGVRCLGKKKKEKKEEQKVEEEEEGEEPEADEGQEVEEEGKRWRRRGRSRRCRSHAWRLRCTASARGWRASRNCDNCTAPCSWH